MTFCSPERMATVIVSARQQALHVPKYDDQTKQIDHHSVSLRGPPDVPRLPFLSATKADSTVANINLKENDGVQKLEDVHGYYFISKKASSSKQLAVQQKNIDREWLLSDSMKSAARVERFLSGRRSDSDSRAATAMTAGHSVFVEELGDRAKPDRFNATKSHEMQFTFPGTTSSSEPIFSTDFWCVRSSNIKAADSLLNTAGNPNFDSAEIYTGLCLWSMGVVVGPAGQDVSNPIALLSRMCWSNESAETTLSRLESSPPTLYETEGMCRLASAIANMAAIIHDRLHSSVSDRRPLRMTLDLPDMQYYFLAVQARKAGHWTSEDGQRYADIVQRRCARIGNAFREAIAAELAVRGIRNLEVASVSIAQASGMQAGEEVLRRIMAADTHDSVAADVERVLCALRNGGHGSLWTEFLELLGAAGAPSTPQELVGAFYVYQVLQPVLEKRQERRKAGVAAAVLPVERILTSEATGRANLYIRSPRQRMQERGGSGERLSPLDVVRKVFSPHTVNVLEKSFYADGLL